MEASFYDNIIEQQRLEPEFFRMGFYGRKFPFFLRVSSFFWRFNHVNAQIEVKVNRTFACVSICMCLLE